MHSKIAVFSLQVQNIWNMACGSVCISLKFSVVLKLQEYPYACPYGLYFFPQKTAFLWFDSEPSSINTRTALVPKT